MKIKVFESVRITAVSETDRVIPLGMFELPDVRPPGQYRSKIGHEVDPAASAVYVLPGTVRVDGGAVGLVEIYLGRVATVSEVDLDTHVAEGECDQPIRFDCQESTAVREVVDVGPMVSVACLDPLVCAAILPPYLGPV